MQQLDETNWDASLGQVRLTRLDQGAGLGADAEDRPPSANWFARWRWLICLLPTVLATAYFGLLAANRYESEVKFVVRTPLSSAAGQLSSMMQGSNVVRSADDAYIVYAYLRSRVAMRELMAVMPLQKMLTPPWTDFIWYYPRPFMSPSEQRLYQHFERFVETDFDQTTGISTLRVVAFRPEDAVAIAKALLGNAEKLINKLNARVMQDSVDIALKEVESSQKLAVEKQQDLTKFRSKWEIVDPLKISNSAHERIGKLSLEAAQTRAQISEFRKLSPQSTQIGVLQVRVAAIEDQIRNEQLQLAGQDGSLAPRIAEYERFLLFREFAERSFLSAMTSLEIARGDAQRQRLYLEQISTPLPADHYTYPYRIVSILLVAGLGVAAYVITQGAGSKH